MFVFRIVPKENKSSVPSPIPIPKEKLPEVLFDSEELGTDQRVYLTTFMAHFMMMYAESSLKSPIEFPAGISHSNRVILHHILDKLGLGSFTRGSKGEFGKWVILA